MLRNDKITISHSERNFTNTGNPSEFESYSNPESVVTISMERKITTFCTP
jgi:hypothetical protein